MRFSSAGSAVTSPGLSRLPLHTGRRYPRPRGLCICVPFASDTPFFLLPWRGPCLHPGSVGAAQLQATLDTGAWVGRGMAILGLSRSAAKASRGRHHLYVDTDLSTKVVSNVISLVLEYNWRS